jgi:AraC-like DNA-binding protein
MAAHLASILERYTFAWERNDAEAIIALFAEDGIYVDVLYKETYQGEALRNYFRTRAFKGCEKMEHIYTDEVIYTKDSISYQYLMRGYNQHNEWVELEGVDFLKINNGKIVRLQEYYNWDQALKGENIKPPKKYKKSALSPEKIQSLKSTLEQLIEQTTCYRNSKLTIGELATELDISINSLSQVINSAFGINFNEWINHYRIDEAKELLRTLPPQQGIILAIGLTVGFNSSATFYSTFKKITGTTPSQYRQTHYKQ